MKIKICGLNNLANIREIDSLNPDYLGFIFYKNSKRYVGKDFNIQALHLKAKKVGVFVEPEFEYISQQINSYNFDVLQVHSENQSLFASLKENYKGIIIWKACSIDDNFNFDSLEVFNSLVDKYLFDTKIFDNFGTMSFGGTGKSFNWQKLIDYNLGKKFFIAGGLGTDNIGELLEFIKSNPLIKDKLEGLDFNSKLEITPGVKSIEKVKEILALINSN